MEKLINDALEQKNVLMGNNVEAVRKGAHESESEPKQCFGFSSGWFLKNNISLPRVEMKIND